MARAGDSFDVKLLELLGISTEKCMKAVLTFTPGSSVKAEITYGLRKNPTSDEIEAVTQHYSLVADDER